MQLERCYIKMTNIFILMGINHDNGNYAMYCAGVFTTKRKAVHYALLKQGHRKLNEMVTRSAFYLLKRQEYDDKERSDEDEFLESIHGSHDSDGNAIYPYEYYDSLIDDHMTDFDKWDDLELRQSEFYLYQDMIDPLISDFNLIILNHYVPNNQLHRN
jgi:hypothetical protein